MHDISIFGHTLIFVGYLRWLACVTFLIFNTSKHYHMLTINSLTGNTKMINSKEKVQLFIYQNMML